MKATFPKSERLCSKLEIEHLFANGISNRFGDFTARFVRLHNNAGVSRASTTALGSTPAFPEALEGNADQPKILISVPKRYQKRSVDRNRTKRLIREIFRKNKHILNGNVETGHAPSLQHNIGNIQTLAIIYTSSKIPDYARVEDQLPKLLEKIR